MKDRRRPPFCYQTIACTAAIRAALAGKELNTALGIYQSMTELANQHHTADGRAQTFAATRRELAEFAGVGKSTLDRYVTIFEDLGVVEVERRMNDDGTNLPNVWALIDAPEGVAQPT